MLKLAASAGHNANVTGAHGYIVEHIENRKVLASVGKYIKELGWQYVNCTDDKSETAAGIVNGAVAKHNNQPDADCDIQLHFNASVGTHEKAIGVECIVSTKARPQDRQRADRIADKLAKELGLPRRKTIVTDKFGFPRMTVHGIIVEVCFVNSKADTDAYKAAGSDAVGKWIAEAIANKAVQAPKPVAPSVKPPTNKDKLGVLKTKRDVQAYAEPKWGEQLPNVVKKDESRNVYTIKDGWYQLSGGEWLPSQSGANFSFEAVKKDNPSTNNLRRVIVDGKQVGAYSSVNNILAVVEDALKANKTKIEVERV